MRPEELQELLKNYSGIKVTTKTIYNYARHGLIPEPSRKNLGRAGGIVTEYPEEAAIEAIVAWKLINAHQIPLKRVKEARKNALDFIVTKINDEWRGTPGFIDATRQLTSAYYESFNGKQVSLLGGPIDFEGKTPLQYYEKDGFWGRSEKWVAELIENKRFDAAAWLMTLRLVIEEAKVMRQNKEIARLFKMGETKEIH